ncbi:DMT family transporter [Flavobacterium sp.]|uniref:DMT family transporter n=1 Tax=Flavobacterium sp. TaxID=239 RepID=UPI002631E002|nr:DMT family transporter [Flavobacterium sp.]
MLTKNNKWFLFIMLSLIWGSSFILIKRGLVGLTPFQLGSLRIIFASLFLLIIAFKSLASIPKNKWKYIALTAISGILLPVYLFSFAQMGISSSVSGILNSLTPLYTLLLGALAFGLVFKKNQIFGVLLGLTGCLMLVLNSDSADANQNYFYALFVVAATFCYALNVNLVKRYLSEVSPLSIITGNFVILLIPAVVVLCCTDFFSVVQKPETLHSIWFIVILGIIGTGIANLIYYKLIQISSPLFASSVTYVIPIVAFAWGLLDGEMLTPFQFLGAFVILTGVYMASKK